MKQSIYIVLLTAAISIAAGCTDIDKENPYGDQLHTLQVTAVYPEGYTEYLREGITVKIEDVDRGNSYKAKTDKDGTVQFSLTQGIYRVQISDKSDQDIFNGLADNVKLTDGDMALICHCSTPERELSSSRKSTAAVVPNCLWKGITSPINILSCTITIRKYNTSTVYASGRSTLTMRKPPTYG